MLLKGNPAQDSTWTNTQVGSGPHGNEERRGPFKMYQTLASPSFSLYVCVLIIFMKWYTTNSRYNGTYKLSLND